MLARFALIAAVLATALVATAHDDQRYNQQERIPLFVDNLIPEHNPSESYRYYSLRFCKSSELKYKAQTLGEVLQGSRKVYSKYDIPFGVDVPHEVVCTEQLSAADVQDFRDAIQSGYHFTMYYDEIPLRGYVGEVDAKDGSVYLYTTLNFKLSFNLDRVVEAHVLPDAASRVKLPAPTEMGGSGGDKKASLAVTFAFTAKWHETDVAFEDRSANNAADVHEDDVTIQWFSILNSCVLVILLLGFLSFTVSRILLRDWGKQGGASSASGGGGGNDDDDEVSEEEVSWKRLHGDVFRFPEHKALFCGILGCGAQLLLLFVCMLTLAVVGVFYPHGRGTALAAGILIYSVTAVVAGFTSGAWYKKIGGGNWVHSVLTTVTLFVGPVFVVWAVLNTIAIGYGSTAALPFATIVALFTLYLLVTFPLTLAGAIIGKNTADEFRAPTRTRLVPRQIPDNQPWYQSSFARIFVAGFLPFSAIYVELYYVFISMWGHQMFTLFGILYLVFAILLLVTAAVVVSVTFLQLISEDHRWWWPSLISGGSAAGFVMLYSWYFLHVETKMTGLLQISFYFGYTSLLCYALFLMLGAVGFFASLVFVREIYGRIKSD